jgi:hypothetical protein
MNNLISYTDFINDLIIPLNNEDEIIKLDSFICKYQNIYLKKGLGISLYNDFKKGLETDPIEEKWVNLINGSIYTTDTGVMYEFVGLKEMLCYFVYYEYKWNEISFTTSIGEKTINSSSTTTSNYGQIIKCIESYNKGVNYYGIPYLNNETYNKNTFNNSLFNFIYYSNLKNPQTYCNWVFTELSYKYLL